MTPTQLDSVDRVTSEAWNALLDPAEDVFCDWNWLDAIERSGSIAEAGDWTPSHLALFKDGRLVAAAPAYIHTSSDGDFSQDWGWAESVMRAGVPWYPKLCITVPFTPASGRRIFVAPGEDRGNVVAELMALAESTALAKGCRSIQVLFASHEETIELGKLGFTARMGHQFHWSNPGYTSFDDFLARLTAKKRHQLKRERAAPGAQGISIETIRAETLTRDVAYWAGAVDRLHDSTVDKLAYGRRWLNRRFYELILERMADRIEIVAARKDGELIAGAFNVAARSKLFGRYWGCFEEHPFLHFNVCLYHSIDECIRKGIRVFEPGAGGEHKLSRGFEPVATWSAHRFLDPRIDRPLRAAIADERRGLDAAIAHWSATAPVLKREFAPDV